MSKVSTKILPFIFAIFVFAGIGAFVLQNDREKRTNKALALENFYTNQYGEWETYMDSYTSQVEDLKAQNRKDMEIAKENYQSLLAQQDAVIEQHTKTIEETTTVTAQSNSTKQITGNVTSSSSAKKQVIAVPKPKTKASTGAS